MVATLKDIKLEDIDPDLRAVVEAVREGEARRDKAMKSITDLLATLGDGAVIEEVKTAVDALEEDVEKINKTFAERLDELKRQRTSNPHYEGHFQSEEDARYFGLCVMRDLCGWDKAGEVIERDFSEYHKRAMASNPESQGGALIDGETYNRFIRLVEQYGVIEGKAFSMPMGSDSISFKRRTGGITVHIGTENVAAPASQPTLARVVLSPQEWVAYTEIPMTLEEDAAVDVGELVFEEMAWAFAKKMDDTVMSGDGTSTYGGIKGLRASLIDINGVDDGGGLVIASGNAWSEITDDDINKLTGQLPQYMDATGMEPEYYCSKPFFWQVFARLAKAGGGVTAQEIEGTRRLLFNGIVTNLMPSMPKTPANSHIPLLYGSVRDTVTLGRRRGMRFDTSRDFKFAERQLALMGTRRVAVAVHSLGDADDAGAMIGLITAAG